MRPALVLITAFALLSSAAGGAAQQPDTAALRRVLERLHHPGVRVRLALRGSTPVTGSIIGVRRDSVLMRRFGLPDAMPLVTVDTVWERVTGDTPALKPGFVAGSMLGFAAGGLALSKLCERQKGQNCAATGVAGGIVAGAILGNVGAWIASRGKHLPPWTRRYP